MQKILRIDPKDNLIVALRDLAQGDIIENEGQRIQLVTDVPAKHKFTREPVPVGGIVTLYGVPVGKPSPRSSPASASPWTTWSTTRRKST